MIIIGAVVRFKKAYMLISGINTSSPERRAKMDLNKICNVVGNTLMAGGVLWIAAGAADWLGFKSAPLIMLPVFIAGMLAMTIYIQRYDSGNKDDKSKPDKGAKLTYAFTGVGAVIALAVVGVLMFSGMKAPDVTLDGDLLTVKGTFGCTVNRENVNSVTLVDTLPQLRRTFGFGGGSSIKGRFSSTLGSGYAYLNTNSPPYIYMTLDGESGMFLYLNFSDKTKTEELYTQIKAWVE